MPPCERGFPFGVSRAADWLLKTSALRYSRSVGIPGCKLDFVLKVIQEPFSRSITYQAGRIVVLSKASVDKLFGDPLQLGGFMKFVTRVISSESVRAIVSPRIRVVSGFFPAVGMVILLVSGSFSAVAAYQSSEAAST